ncbi:ribbon-helix-helix domain-containing protein [Geminicoccus flavidas]|uniref:ribbon-helix-helix domain-containing protein n=1 Tax=Geminicoccus flavidas TaxID=2506407 RepID=UPI00135A544A|nr:ribbon-helix-helix domain-containing protein [Geminicoccus flavidas]
MCRIYSATDPKLYEQVTKSVRLHGAVTSIRLEARFWTILDEIAQREGISTPRFVTKLYDEVLDREGEVRNFASLLRVVCTIYLDRVKPAAQPVAAAAA